MFNQLKLKIRNSALMLFLISSCSFLHAQVNIEFSAINEYAFNTRQALNLVIVNSNPKVFSVFIQGKITDGNGQMVVEFKSSEVLLSIGSTIVTPMNTSLSDINYHNQDIAEIENRTGTYPSGNYNICIWLNCVTQDCSGAGRDAAGMEQIKCTPVHIENPTPLILATPDNESEIEETRPLFSWIPPSPVAGSSNLNYTMILVEMMEGQNKADALNMNRPLIEMEGISNPALIFPSDLPELEKGKWYAWQVQAFVGKTPIAKSEQWKFKIKKKEEKKPLIKQAVFLKMKNEQYLHDLNEDSLFIGINHIPNAIIQQGFITFTVMDYSGKIIQKINFEIEYDDQNSGYYLLKIPIELIVPDQKGGEYLLQFKDLKDENCFLKIRIK